MTLNEWITLQIEAGYAATRQDACRKLHKEIFENGDTTTSVHTLKAIDAGLRLRTYARAEAISRATGGMVTIRELCK